MRSFSFFRAISLAVLAAGFFSCSNKTEPFISEQLSEYIILEPGKYITYRLDSLVFTSFGVNVETHRYQLKHVVDQQITDNLGRPSWRINMFISDSTGTDAWNAYGTYMITPLNDQVEVIDDNLRIIKLHMPMREGFEWPGNSYLPFNPYSAYDFSNDDDMTSPDWNFSYESFEPSSFYRDQTYTDVWTVEQFDDANNIPLADPGNYGFKTEAMEKYAKGIGLVYRKYVFWEYQPNPSGVSPYNTGFGITMWMVDHN
jgi:hypothetical protein